MCEIPWTAHDATMTTNRSTARLLFPCAFISPEGFWILCQNCQKIWRDEGFLFNALWICTCKHSWDGGSRQTVISVISTAALQSHNQILLEEWEKGAGIYCNINNRKKQCAILLNLKVINWYNHLSTNSCNFSAAIFLRAFWRTFKEFLIGCLLSFA